MPGSLLGRCLPRETLVVMDAVYPSSYVRRNEKGELDIDSVREFASEVRLLMQNEIAKRSGCSAFYRGQLERIRGIND